ncbi:MAG: hypothetical protein AAF663_12070 [Planctomycetota bacterium]
MNARLAARSETRRIPSWTAPAVLIAMFAVAIALTVAALAGGWSASGANERMEALSARLGGSSSTDEQAKGDSEEQPGSSRGRGGGSGLSQLLPEGDPGRSAAERIRGRYIFAPKPPERFRAVRGVLGDVVLLQDGSAVGIGDNVDGAVVREIGPEWVRYEYNGEDVVVHLEGADRTSGLSRGRTDIRGPSSARDASERRPRSGAGEAAPRERRSDGQRRTRRLPGIISPEVLERIRQRAGDNVEIIVDEEP